MAWGCLCHADRSGQTRASGRPHGARAARLRPLPACRTTGSCLSLRAPGVRLPTWFRGHDWHHRAYYTASGLFSRAGFLTARPFGEFAVDISSPERAILEYLDGFPAQASFEEARELLEGLTTLRPEVLQSLLEACTSVKVKRMFLYLADQVKHSWRAKLKDKRIKLGSGKRLLVRGGSFDPRYLITVPTQAPVSDT